MRGFLFRLSLKSDSCLRRKTCWPAADEVPRRTREKTSRNQDVLKCDHSKASLLRSTLLWNSFFNVTLTYETVNENLNYNHSNGSLKALLSCDSKLKLKILTLCNSTP